MAWRRAWIQVLGPVSLLLASLLWTACEVIGGPEKKTRAINHLIEFRLAEEHEIAPTAPDVPKIFFTMSTEDPFGCSGYRIQNEVVRSGERITVRVTGIDPPDGLCVPVGAPASARHSLSLDPGAYTLVLANGDLRDEYTATVTDRRIELEARTRQWTEPDGLLYWRYPRDSFGYYCEGPTEEICDGFESRLETLPLTSIEVPDRGAWPYNRGHRMELYLNAPGQFYRYPDENTWSDVETRLRDFACERDSAEIVVRNWLSDSVRSWGVECGG